MSPSQYSLNLPISTPVQIACPNIPLSPNPHFGDYGNPNNPPLTILEPYEPSITAGKNTHVYDAHTYHTKVPPQGIQHLIEYYTRPGDVVLDPFCGSGMTGIACADNGRIALLSDLSPAATFISWNINKPVNAANYMEAVNAIVSRCDDLERALYVTHCRTCSKETRLFYTVWSYGLLCNVCNHEFILWDVALDEKPRSRDSKIKDDFDCPHCMNHIKKRGLKRTRRYPVAVGYKCCQSGLKEVTCPLDEFDRRLLANLDATGLPDGLWYPTNTFPKGENTKQPINAGITTVDKAYTPRALWAFAQLWQTAISWPDEDIRAKLLFTLTSLYQRITVFSEFRFWGGSGNTANFNVPAIMNEQNVFRTFVRKAETIHRYFLIAPQNERQLEVSTQSAIHLPQIRDKSVDYVFTDPPFGGNINYSEMNFLWESWLGVFTRNTEEAIINKVQGKGVAEYTDLLTRSFAEVHRVLKDDGWLTVVFHNSSDKVWNCIQAAITDAGFYVRGTQTFDKEHGTFKQYVSENAVGYDLLLHCKKGERTRPRLDVEPQESLLRARAFIKQQLEDCPHQYVVKFLHVIREDEFDYRRLYANWLAEVLTSAIVNLSFEEFRTVVNSVLQERIGNVSNATS